MKKLVTMLAALATGFFAYSGSAVTSVTDDIKNMEEGSTSIVGFANPGTLSAVKINVRGEGQEVHWWSDAADVLDENYEQPATVGLDGADPILNIESDSNNALLRTFSNVTESDDQTGTYEYAPVAIENHGLFIDTKVKFTPSAEDPQSTADSKLIVWALEIEAEDAVGTEGDDGYKPAVEAATNLMVTCGAIENKQLVPTNYTLKANFDASEFYQLTIRADVDNNDGKTYFRIFLDEKELTVANKKFLSLIDNQQLAKVAYVGTGSVKSVDLLNSTDAPEFAADPTVVTFTYDANVASILVNEVEIKEVGKTEVALPITKFGENISVVVTYAGGYRRSSITATGDVVAPVEIDDSFNFSVARYAAGTIDIVSEPDRDEATLTINGVAVPKSDCGTLLGGIFGCIADLESTDKVVITLGNSANLGNVVLEEVDYDIYADVTIDLHGCTIVSNVTAEPEDESYFFWVDSAAKLTITDSVGGGAIVAPTNVGIIYNAGTTVVEKAADGEIAFTGEIVNAYDYDEVSGATVEGAMTLLGGKYTVQPYSMKEDDAEYGITLGTLADPLKWHDAQIDNFWTLDPIGAVINVIGNAGLEFVLKTNGTAVATGAKLVLGEKIEVVATLKEGYAFDGDLTGWVVAGDTATFTIDAVASVAESITIPCPDTKIAATPFAIIVAGEPVYFDTLQDAINAAGTGDYVDCTTVTILDSCVLDARVTVSNKTVTLAASETPVTISCATDRVLSVLDNANVTIDEGVTLTSAKNPTVFVLGTTAAKAEGDETKSTLVVNGTIANTNSEFDKTFALCGNGDDYDGVNITIGAKGVVSNANGAAIYFPNPGKLTVNGTVEGYSAIIIKDGELVVNNGAVITATGANYQVFPRNTNGATPTGDAIIAGYYGEALDYGTPEVTINGGTITVNTACTGAVGVQGYDSDERVAPDDAKNNIEVAGGTFNAPVAEGYCADGYIPKENDDGTYGVKEGFYVARVNGEQGYETLAAAVAAAQANDEITLIADTTLNATLTIDKALAFNLAGKTVTFGNGVQKGITTEPNGFDGNLVISNGNFAVDGTRPAKGYAFVLYRVNALIKDVEMDLEGFEYGLEAETMPADRNDYWTKNLIYTIDCQNVKIEGNGSLFHFENVIANLDEDCSATLKGTSFGGAHGAAIYSSCGAKVTVAGGTYNALNALQTGSLGGTLIVKGGEFTGNIKSFMLDEDTRYEKNAAYITIEGGKFTGDFVYDANCSKDCTRLNVAISAGNFSAKNIPVAFIVPVEHKVAKWIDSTIPDYVTPGYDWEKVKAIWVVDTVATTNEVVYNTVPEKPDDPEKANYTFTGWQPTPGDAITEDTEYTAQFEAITYKYTFAKGGAAGDATVADITYTVETAETLTAPAAGADWTVADSEFAGWTNKVDGGEIILTGAELAKALKDIELTAVWVATAPDFPVDDDKNLDENGKAAVETAKTVFGADLADYVTAVYTDGKIPAAKLNATSEELIKIAKEYNLPIMEAGKVAIEITESATANAFEFQIKDNGTAVSLAAAEAAKKILSMVEFTDDLGDAMKPFATATTDNVTVAIKDDSENKIATATFTKATAAGFMRVNLKAE